MGDALEFSVKIYVEERQSLGVYNDFFEREFIYGREKMLVLDSAMYI